MTTITRFTKEQLIARADHLLCVGKAFIAEHPEYYGMAKDVELFNIALASLEAEPALYAAEETLAYANMGELHLTCLSEPMGDAVIPLYTAPPAPVSVPDEITFEKIAEITASQGYEYSINECICAASWWNACRAAMLQGKSDGNYPVISDCWVACSERLPPEGYEEDGGAVCYLVWHKNEADCGPHYSISNVFFLRKHWEKNFTHWMPLPAAPQQEVK